MERPPSGEKGWNREIVLHVVTVAARHKMLLAGELLFGNWYAHFGAEGK